MRTRFYTIMLFLLAACGTQSPQTVSELPTLAQVPTETATQTVTVTFPATFTLTPTITETPTLTVTPTLSITPSATITETPTPTLTVTPTPTETPPPPPDNEGISALIALAAQVTILPQAQQPAVIAPTIAGGTLPPLTVSCAVTPTGGFGTAYTSDPTLTSLIGCPVGTSLTMSSASQLFERGGMFWLQGPPGYHYALFSTGRFQRYDDTYNTSIDPVSGGETPPSGLLEPVRGFGKVWRSNNDVRTSLGWATTEENGGTATTQLFDRGLMVYLPQRGEIITLVYDPGGMTGTWRAVAGTA